MKPKTAKCEHCRKAYTPTRVSQKYCSQACRQAAYRKRHSTPKRKPKAKPEPVLHPATCKHCGGQFWAANKRQIFCGVSCRTRHYQEKRKAVVVALSEVFAIDQDHAGDVIESVDFSRVQSVLVAHGLQYRHELRRWLPAAL